MENLGWWIYFCSIADGIIITSIIAFAICMGFFLYVPIFCGYDEDDEIFRKWVNRSGIISILSLSLIILVPSKTTCYQIFGVSIATELIQNSEALQELPEKSIEALNRFLDSIAEEEKSKE